MKCDEAFNKLANVYDHYFSDAEAITENEQLFEFIQSSGFHKGNILDMGCGTGLFLEYMQDVLPTEYLGIDISENMLQKAQQKFPQHQFKRADMQDTSLISNSFDTVISTFGSFSYCEWPENVITEIARMLKPQGEFLIMAYTHQYQNRESHIINKCNTPTYFRTYSSTELYNLFKRHFTNAKVIPFTQYFWNVTGTQRMIDPKIEKMIGEQPWRNAKTYEKFAPHEYIIKQWNPDLFNALYQLIKEQGVNEKFKLFNNPPRTYKYLYLGEYKYWSIYPVLNREKVINKCQHKSSIQMSLEKQ